MTTGKFSAGTYSYHARALDRTTNNRNEFFSEISLKPRSERTMLTAKANGNCGRMTIKRAFDRDHSSNLLNRRDRVPSFRNQRFTVFFYFYINHYLRVHCVHGRKM